MRKLSIIYNPGKGLDGLDRFIQANDIRSYEDLERCRQQVIHNLAVSAITKSKSINGWQPKHIAPTPDVPARPQVSIVMLSQERRPVSQFDELVRSKQ